MLKRAIPAATREQAGRQSKCRLHGCIHCLLQGVSVPLPVEISHIADTGRQLGQDYTVASCSWHHRGICLDGWTVEQMALWFGPSLHHASKAFYATFGSIAEQVVYQNVLIGHTAAPITAREARRSKPARGATARPSKMLARSTA